MKKTILLFFLSIAVYGQTPTQEFSYNEFIGFVKKYHPLVKKAQLEISAAQANLMMARGGFDPKIAADFEQKKFNFFFIFLVYSFNSLPKVLLHLEH